MSLRTGTSSLRPRPRVSDVWPGWNHNDYISTLRTQAHALFDDLSGNHDCASMHRLARRPG